MCRCFHGASVLAAEAWLEGGVQRKPSEQGRRRRGRQKDRGHGISAQCYVSVLVQSIEIGKEAVKKD